MSRGGWSPLARRGRGYRRLQARLLVWFFVAIVLAIGASAVTTFLTRDDGMDSPARLVSRHVQQRVARLWDDPSATDAYVASLRDATGLDLRVRRDASMLPGRRPRSAGVVFEDGVAYVPVVKHGVAVGALELRTGASPPEAWRLLVALLAALLVLGAVARRVSIRLAGPLEQVASAAERFGAGDLSARTRVERLPRRWLAEEIRELGVAFDRMADRIARVVLEQRELLAAISHELRSPLGRARVALEIARERSEPVSPEREAALDRAPIMRALDDVDRQLGEMDAILGDLLASARAGLADLRREPVDLGAWLRERAAVETRGPVEVVDELGRDVRVEIDRALLGRALHNLLANAWAHGHPSEVPLVITATLAGDQVRVAVHDQGPGFAADILPRAFDPFITGTGTARSPGTRGIGLGLSLVRRIVEAHGGRAFAQNVEPKRRGAPRPDRPAGALVAFELPLARVPAGEARPGSSSAAEPPGAERAD